MHRLSAAPALLAALAFTATGCIGAHGTRQRAYLIDTAIGATGGGLLVAGLNADDFDDGLGLTFIGFTMALVGVAGLVLTGVGQVGEARRRSSGATPLIAVRAWTSLDTAVAFDPAWLDARPEARERARRALAAARGGDCPATLELIDQLWTSERVIHAQLVRDPAVAACIRTGASTEAP